MTGYAWKVGEELDRFLNVVGLNGEVGQTISNHAALARMDGRRWGCLLCRWLSVTVETNHCEKTLMGKALSERAGLFAGLQLLVLFLALTGLFWWGILR